MNDKINKILARGVIIKYTFDKNNVEYDDIKIDDNNIYQNTIIMIDTIINNSIPLTNRRKVAKYMRKNLETIRIHE